MCVRSWKLIFAAAFTTMIFCVSFDPGPRRRSSRHACMLEIACDLDGIQYRRNDFQITAAAGTSCSVSRWPAAHRLGKGSPLASVVVSASGVSAFEGTVIAWNSKAVSAWPYQALAWIPGTPPCRPDETSICIVTQPRCLFHPRVKIYNLPDLQPYQKSVKRSAPAPRKGVLQAGC